jgi:hypothetical protein
LRHEAAALLNPLELKPKDAKAQQRHGEQEN